MHLLNAIPLPEKMLHLAKHGQSVRPGSGARES